MSNPATETRHGTTSLPGADVPSFSSLVDKSLASSKDANEKMTTIAEGMSDAFREAFACANRGCAEYGMKMVEIARAHSDATFNAAADCLAVTSPTELLEVSSTHARKRFELVAQQMKELTALSQRVLNEAAEPIRNGISEPLRLAG